MTGRGFDPANPSSPLGYSDGTQSSRPFASPPRTPTTMAGTLTTSATRMLTA